MRNRTAYWRIACTLIGTAVAVIILIKVNNNAAKQAERTSNASRAPETLYTNVIPPLTDDLLRRIAKDALRTKQINIHDGIQVEIESDAKYYYIVFGPHVPLRPKGEDYIAKVVVDKSSGAVREVIDLDQEKGQPVAK